MVKIIFVTTNFKTKIPQVKIKNHVLRINYQNFSLIWRLTKRESSFYQEDVVVKNWVAPNTDQFVKPSDQRHLANDQRQSIRKNEHLTLPREA